MGAPALVNAAGTISGGLVGVLLELLLLNVIAFEKAFEQPNHILTYLVVLVNIATFVVLDWFSDSGEPANY